MNALTVTAAWVALAGLGSPMAGAASGAEVEIRALQSEQANAWNRHDAHAYAQLFTADGDVVNVLGWLWQGRDEIEGKLTRAFSSVFAASHLKITDVQVKLIAPRIAVAHVRWTLEGAAAPPGGQPPREGIQLQVLVRQGEGWRIKSLQNTNSVPEREFPQGAR
jgi:uncharacterized protein (TIGR02246 family)